MAGAMGLFWTSPRVHCTPKGPMAVLQYTLLVRLEKGFAVQARVVMNVHMHGTAPLWGVVTECVFIACARYLYVDILLVDVEICFYM